MIQINVHFYSRQRVQMLLLCMLVHLKGSTTLKRTRPEYILIYFTSTYRQCLVKRFIIDHCFCLKYVQKSNGFLTCLDLIICTKKLALFVVWMFSWPQYLIHMMKQLFSPANVVMDKEMTCQGRYLLSITEHRQYVAARERKECDYAKLPAQFWSTSDARDDVITKCHGAARPALSETAVAENNL